jgi:hypothetical protein
VRLKVERTISYRSKGSQTQIECRATIQRKNALGVPFYLKADEGHKLPEMLPVGRKFETTVLDVAVFIQF